MNKKPVFVQHAIISLIAFAILLGIIFSIFSFIPEILTFSQVYTETKLTPEEMQYLSVQILLVIVSVLLSYVFYLLLSSRTRSEILAFKHNKIIDSSLRQFTKLYEESPVPYILLDEEGGIHNPNKSALRFFEVIQEEIEGKNIFDLQIDQKSEKNDRLIRYFKSNIPINRQEVQFVTKSGDVKWVIFSIFNTKNGDYSGLATIFDITEQKKLDKAKTEFLSLASHQLRTPVATIKWYLEMLLSNKEKSTPEKQEEYLLRTQKVTEDMVELIDALLNVSRIEIGSIKPEIKEVNLIEIVEGILNEMIYMTEQKKIEVIKKYRGNLSKVTTDPKIIRIVIHNLISNSFKYTLPNGKVTIELSESFGKSTITISDTGVGIPKDEQSKIFSKMFRALNVKNLIGNQGTGLGLYLVKSLLDIIGAKISFISEENVGSKFTIKL
jgi:two-component system, OmpR family, sensor histidine kinase VicK